MRRLLILLGIGTCLGVAAIITTIVSPDACLWVKLHTIYRPYNAWKHEGGPWRWAYNEAFMQDRWRDEAILNLTVAELRRKLPFLIDGSTYPEHSARGMVLERARAGHADTGIYWFEADEQCPLAIRTRGGVGESFQLYKG